MNEHQEFASSLVVMVDGWARRQEPWKRVTLAEGGSFAASGHTVPLLRAGRAAGMAPPSALCRRFIVTSRQTVLLSPFQRTNRGILRVRATTVAVRLSRRAMRRQRAAPVQTNETKPLQNVVVLNSQRGPGCTKRHARQHTSPTTKHVPIKWQKPNAVCWRAAPSRFRQRNHAVAVVVVTANGRAPRTKCARRHIRVRATSTLRRRNVSSPSRARRHHARQTARNVERRRRRPPNARETSAWFSPNAS